MPTVGIIANPHAGKDIRRLTSNASVTSDVAKLGTIRRAAVGAIEGGATRLLVAPDGHRLAERACGDLDGDVVLEVLDEPVEGRASDTVAMAVRMAKEDVDVVIVLGGDGTHRDVAKGWLDVPLVAVSTGTNNVFPRLVEGTLAGLAAGLLAAGVVTLAEVSMIADVIHVSFDDGTDDDLALVDVALLDGHYIGSRAIWEPERLRSIVSCIAEAAGVGLSAVAGLLHASPRTEPGGVYVSLCGGNTVRVPLAPGSFATLSYDRVETVAEGRSVEIRGPGVLAFDGERDRVLAAGVTATLTIRRNGPYVVDVERAVSLAASRHHFERS